MERLEEYEERCKQNGKIVFLLNENSYGVIVAPCADRENVFEIVYWSIRKKEYRKVKFPTNRYRGISSKELDLLYEFWPNPHDRAGRMAYCELAIDLALESGDRDWFERSVIELKHLQALLTKKEMQREN